MDSSILNTPCRVRVAQRFLCAWIALILSTAMLFGQSEEISEEAPADADTKRPTQTDATSQKVIHNYLVASGGEQAHRDLKNISAKGVIIEAGNIRNFELIETNDGKRRLTYKWRHLGKNYSETLATNGKDIWKQQTQPVSEFAKAFGGLEAKHFAHQFWLLQPLLQPDLDNVVYQYQGSPKVLGRPTHLIVGFWPNNVRTWIYFDQKTFLPVRWGGLSKVASADEYVDYRSIRFEAVESVFLPKAVDLLIDDDSFGEIKFTSIQANVPIKDSLFEMPVYESPVLRQKPQKTDVAIEPASKE